MSTTVLSASRAGLGSVVVADPSAIIISVVSNIGVYDPGFIKRLGAAAMDGAAAVSAVGRTVASTVAQMDGQSDMLAASAILRMGAASMDGHADMMADGAELASGAGHLDGLADVLGASASLGRRGGQMDGVASVIAISVEGATVGQMDGAGSLDATAPHYFNTYLQDGVIGGQTTSPKMTYNVTLPQGVASLAVMKPKVRYHLSSSFAISLPQAISYKMRFVKLMREVAIMVTPSLEPHSQFHFAVTFPMNVGATLIPKFRAVYNMVQNLTVGQTTIPKFIWGRALTEVLKISDPYAAHMTYKASLAQLVKLIETEGFKLKHPVTLSQQINLSQLLTGGMSVKLLQKLLVSAAASPASHYHLMLDSRVRLGDTLEHLVNEILAELFTVHDTLGRQFIAGGALSQLLTVHPALNSKLVLKLVGNIQVSPEQLVHMLYRGDPLLDGVVIDALYISPSGTTTAWAVNTRTAAVTEYLNYDFNSFALLGNRYVAAGPDGLYELDGDTDDGALIISDLMGGYLQLNEKKMFGIKGVYVAIRGGGRFYLKLVAGDGREYVYELKAQPNLMTTKVKVGKGISTTYMAWELITEGQDFDLDSIEFIPMTRGRRV
jgi:hypothetical protein